MRGVHHGARLNLFELAHGELLHGFSPVLRGIRILCRSRADQLARWVGLTTVLVWMSSRRRTDSFLMSLHFLSNWGFASFSRCWFFEATNRLGQLVSSRNQLCSSILLWCWHGEINIPKKVVCAGQNPQAPRRSSPRERSCSEPDRPFSGSICVEWPQITRRGDREGTAQPRPSGPLYIGTPRTRF